MVCNVLASKLPKINSKKIYAELKRDIQERDPYGESNSFGTDTEVFRPIEDEVGAPETPFDEE